MAGADGEQGGAQLRPQHRGDGGETQEGRKLKRRHDPIQQCLCDTTDNHQLQWTEDGITVACFDGCKFILHES